MKENEFDIYVRDLLAGAEESVSPNVWKGVKAGLDKAAGSRTVPVWVWRSLAGVAAAAAVVAAVVLTGPEKNLSNQPTINNPVAQATTDAPLPAESVQPEEEAVIPIEQQVSRLQARRAQVREIVTPEVEEEVPAIEEEVVETALAEPERKPDAVVGPADRPEEAFSSDEEAFNQLAFEEHKTRREGRFSVNVLGNIQSNFRPETPASAIRRTAGIFLRPAPTKTGIDSERPEFSFGLPVSAGITFRYDFSPRWGIGTGVVYTNLSRSFMGNYFEVDGGAVTKELYDTDISNIQHYIGVPLNIYFNIVNTGNWNFHVRMDGMGEKLVDNHFLIHDSAGDLHLHEKVDRLQFSTGIGVGVEFRVTPYMGIYLDPTLRYYFDCGQPRSIRTIQPLRMDIEAGVRFSLGR